MAHHKRLEAARNRRDDGTRPLPGDNEDLLAVGENPNPLRLQDPVEPERGSGQDRVLRALRRVPSWTVEDLARDTNSTERQVRGAIDALRKRAQPITNTAFCRFELRDSARLSAA